MARANLKRLEEGKLYYSISEVCSMTGLEQHVLRYWESEFPQLRPKKNRSGNRAYRNKEIKIIRYIKYLLYDELYTIPGAKKKMAEANLADLEGQMTLIRVPAALPREREVRPDGRADGDGAMAAPAAPGYGETDGAEPGTQPGEAPSASEDREAPPDEAADGGFPEGAPGPEAAASEERLRGELLRMLDELKGLLAHLRMGGAVPASGSRITLEASASEPGGGPGRVH